MMLVQAIDLSVRKGISVVVQPISFELHKGTALALTGPSGSGKTSLLEAIAGRILYSGVLHIAEGTKLAYVPQQHQFKNRSNLTSFYYQQRYNASDATDSATIAESLPELFSPPAGQEKLFTTIQDLFGLQALQHRHLLHLSNGENKRLQLAKALMMNPGVLLLDNPFTGLDTEARGMLETCLIQLLQQGTAIILTCSPAKVPAFVQQVLLLRADGTGMVQDAGTVHAQKIISHEVPFDKALLKSMPQNTSFKSFNDAIRMVNVQVRYGDKQILDGINWQVKKGQRWSVSGPNGAGKSTLLSLITADNPQAYANEIYLFDKRRGTGESIWEVKRNIGFVSPELHLHFERSATVFEAVASGFFDTIGLFRQVSESQTKEVLGWLQLLGLAGSKSRLLGQMPLGIQRLVLLARAMVKSPPLLVLDEPLQGLDEEQAGYFKSIIDSICQQTDQTLVFVSHYADDLPACITHGLRLEQGKVVVA